MRLTGLLILFMFPSIIWADSFIDVQMDVVSNDNVSFGNHPKDRLGDASIAFNTLAGKPMPLGDGIFTPTLALEYNAHQTYASLNYGWLKVGLFFKDKFGVGAVPWYTLGLKVGYKYSAEDLRDATLVAFQAGLGSHVTEDLTLSLHYAYEVENATHRVFDATRQIFRVSGDYLWTENIMLLASYAYMKGDIAANMFPNGHSAADSNNTYVLDPVFGSGRSTYRLSDELIEMTALGVNYYVNESSAIELGFEYRRGVSETIWSAYDETLYTCSYILSY